MLRSRVGSEMFIIDSPISVDVLGNTSVATIPTLYDIVLNENFKGHNLEKGDIILFASVGAGMNVNAITYQV